MRGFRGVMLCLAMATALPSAVLAQSVTVGPGAHWHVLDGSLELDCSDLTVAGHVEVDAARLDGVRHLANTGTLILGSGSVEVGGDWRNHGQFLSGTSSVRLVDRCNESRARILGANRFATLAIHSDRGKRYELAAGQTQSVGSALGLTGTAAARLVLRSSQAGARSSIALAAGAAQVIDGVDVADQAAPIGSQWLAPGPAAQFNSVDAGNNRRWFGLPAAASHPVPARSPLMLLSLVLLIVGAGLASLRPRTGSR